MRLKTIVCLSLLCATAPAWSLSCNNPTASLEQVRSCTIAENYKTVDTLYTALVTLEEKKGNKAPVLQQAQTSWLAYRDATCEYTALNPTDLSQCLIKFNTARFKELRQYLLKATN